MILTSASAIASAIQAEYQVFQEFHQLLENEHALLLQSDVDRLFQLAPRKNELLEQLSRFSLDRSQSLAAAGQKNSAAGVEAWLVIMGVDRATRDTWQQLIDLAREAEQRNRDNGILIETALRSNQQALAVLQSASNPNTLYGPTGQLSGVTSGRRFDKA